jgi:transposase
MDDLEQLQRDFIEGRVDLPRLFSFLSDCLRQLQETQTRLQETQTRLQETQTQLQATQTQLQATQTQLQGSQARLQETQQQLKTAQDRIEELEKKLGGPPTPRVDQPYSMRAEEKRQQAKDGKKKNKSKGRRRRHDDKMHLVARTEPVYPQGVPPQECELSHTRLVWRLEEGRAVLVAYEVYRGPKNRYGKIPGVVGRCEFGWEIIIAVAHLTYDLGVSLDKACSILDFFQDLPLRKSQAEALLKQLAKHCEHQFDVLCVLVANSAIVHADETSWSLKSVWAFLSEQARVLLFGVNKDAETLQRIVDADVFQGILFSDDAAVYSRFTQMQKCWAHLIRKAIKLTLQDAQDRRYRLLAEGLLKIYRDARAIQTDATLDAAGKLAQVAALEDELALLCYGKPLPATSRGLEHDYVLLAHEVMRLKDDQSLFTFVTASSPIQPNGETMPVGGTNNEAERTLRNPAEARKTGRTNKTAAGTRRRTIVTSVLQSLRLYLPKYTLKTVIAETLRWLQTGRSCFEEQLQKLKLKLPQESILQQLYPTPQPSD